MQCPECNLHVTPYSEGSLSCCSVCFTPLIPEAADILEHGLYNVTKEVRPAQVQMSQDIEKLFLQENGTLMAEGQTGTGKSFAYLIPALLNKGKRIIIATAKTALQDQLYKKDIPYLCGKLGIPENTCGIYKGRSNYLCRRLTQYVPAEDQKDLRTFLMLHHERPADKAAWPVAKPLLWWSKVDADDCSDPRGCPHRKYCTPKPTAYRILITNHSLVGIDLKIGESPGVILGPYSALILDEGHQATEYFRDAFSKFLKIRSLKTLCRDIAHDNDIGSFIYDQNEGTWDEYIHAVDILYLGLKKTHKAALEAQGIEKRVDPRDILGHLETLRDDAEVLRSKLSMVVWLLQKEHEYVKRVAKSQQQTAQTFTEWSTTDAEDYYVVLLDRAKKYLKKVNNVLDFWEEIDINNPETQILSGDEKGLTLRPLHIGPLVQPKLQQIPHRVVTSATLAIGSDFSSTAKSLGIPATEPLATEIYESPFRVKNRTLLYLPQHLPLPVHENKSPAARRQWIHETALEMAQLMNIMQGDTFVLFTSRVDMNAFIAKLNQENFWKYSGITLCAQDTSAQATLAQFMKTPRSVVFGLKNFWEGIDVPGPKLKLVIIPKLPFPNPGDPLIRAQQRALDAAKGPWAGFNELFIPHMIMEMRQGIGRLIRTSTDRGFIAILDERIWTATAKEDLHNRRMQQFRDNPESARRTGYAKRLLDVLDLPNQTNNIDDVIHWANQWFKLDVKCATVAS